MTMVAEGSLPPPPVGADFFIGWLCAKTWEYYEALKMFDERYSSSHIVNGDGDKSMYHLGRIGSHFVVMNRPPSQAGDENQAPKIAADMKSTFPMIRFIVLVGTGGAAPSRQNDIRLGDVVFGLEIYPYSQVTSENVHKSRETKKPPELLLVATTLLKTGDRSNISLREVENVNLSSNDPPQRPTRDDLYKPSYPCKGNGCDCEDPRKQETISDEKGPLTNGSNARSPLVRRDLARHRDHIMIHTGIVGSADWLMRSGLDRESYSGRCNIICFDTGTAQVMDTVPCLAIRGISDYSDGHRTADWKPYASLVAAICAKKLVCQLQREEVKRAPIKWEPDQLRSYVKGATHTAHQTIGMLDCFQGNLNDAERTASALIERHQFVAKFVNDLLPYLKKDSVRKEIQNEIGEQNTKALYDGLKSIESLQRELKQSLDSLTRNVRKQGKQLQRRDRESGYPDEWKRLEDELDIEVYRAEVLSYRMKAALSITGRLLFPRSDDRRDQETEGISQMLPNLRDKFKYSIKRTSGRQENQWRIPWRSDRQGGYSMKGEEYQDSEQPVAFDEDSFEFFIFSSEPPRSIRTDGCSGYCTE